MKTSTQPQLTNGFIKGFLDTYGPYAFGVASLLLIWFTIVRPELQTRTIDQSESREQLKLIKDVQQSQLEISKQMANTASQLEVSAKIFERIMRDGRDQ